MEGKRHQVTKSQTRDARGAFSRHEEHAVRRLARRPAVDRPPAGRAAAARERRVPGIAAVLPDDGREIVAWIRDYDPALPNDLLAAHAARPAAGSRLTSKRRRSALDVTLAR